MIDNCLQKAGASQDISIRKMPPIDSSNNKNSRTEEKYGLRPRTIIKRLQQERTRQQVPPKTVRSKSRPAPLSKYRRKTANARERHRMKEINNAFDSLRKVLPDAVEIATTPQSTMTKIMTLRLAVNYIRTLSEVLQAEEDGVDLCSLQSSLQCSIEDSLQNCLDQSFQYTFHQSLQKTTQMGSDMPVYGHSHAHYSPHLLPPNQQMMDYTSFSTALSASSSPSTNRGSLSSASDLEELLSDDSVLLEDNIDVFHDIPTLCATDALELLLGTDKEGISFPHELCS